MEMSLYEASIVRALDTLEEVQKGSEELTLKNAIYQARVALNMARSLPDMLFDLPAHERRYDTLVVCDFRQNFTEELELLRQYLPGGAYAGRDATTQWQAVLLALKDLDTAGVDIEPLSKEALAVAAELKVLALTEDPSSALYKK